MAKSEVGRWSEQLRRMFGMAGVERVSAEISPEISPVVVLEQEGGEWDYLKGVKLMWVTQLLTPVVAQNAVFRLRNPEGSGVIGTIQEIQVSLGTLSDIQILVDVTNLDMPQLAFPITRDLRWAKRRLPVIHPSAFKASGNQTVVGGSICFRAANKEFLQTTFPIVVEPGWAVMVQTDANVAAACSWVWKERPLPRIEEGNFGG